MNEIEKLQARARCAIDNKEWSAACDLLDEIVALEKKEVHAHHNP